MIDAHNHYKLQQLQARLIEKTNSTVSFSYVTIEMIRGYYKHGYTTILTNRKHEQADRITIMIDEEVHSKLLADYAKTLKRSAESRNYEEPTSYSRILNQVIRTAFEKGIDKKVIRDAVQE